MSGARPYWKSMFLMPWQRSIHMLKSNEFKQWIQKCSLLMVNSAVLIPKSRVSIALSSNELVENVLIAGFFKAEKCWKGLSIGGKSFEGGHINKKVQERIVKLLINSLAKLSKNLQRDVTLRKNF